jgi:RNA polymerase sigma-70 factor (ECF subfamily)
LHEIEPDALAAHIDRLFRAAWALSGSRQEAEDLVQETFLRVLSKPRRLRRQDELPYLLASLRNTFLDERRRAARRPRAAQGLDELRLADPSGRDDPVAALQTHELFDAIAALPLDFRLALVAVDVAGLSHREAAALLRTREATIATRLFRARARLARQLLGARPSAEPTSSERDARRSESTRGPHARHDEREGNDPGGRLIEEGRR